MDQICHVTTVKKLRKTLESLPIDYDEAYKNTLERIGKQDPERHELARHAMQWVCSSHRPLDMAELQHAIASLNEDDSSYGKEDMATEKSILSACLGLLTHSKASGIVSLVHSSAKDVILGRLRLNNQSSEIRLGKACLRYMSSPEMAKGSCLSLQDLKTRLTIMPFLEYSTRHYGYHVKPVQDEMLTDLMAFLGNESLREAAWQLLHFIFNINSDSAQGVIESMPKGASILHVACYWGFSSVLDQFLSAKPGADVVDFPDSHGWTGLHWAASAGHADIAGILLDASANIEAVDGGNWTPLFWAVVKGHEPVVSLLLGRGANLFHADGSHFTPLHWSVLSRAKDVTALLLERGKGFHRGHIMSDKKPVPARSLSVEQAKALEAQVQGSLTVKNLFELAYQTSDIEGLEQLATSFRSEGYHKPGLYLEDLDRTWGQTKIVLSKSERMFRERRDEDTAPIDVVRRRLLVRAIQCEDLAMVKSIVQLSMDMNKDIFTEAVTLYGATYVHVAAYSGSADIMQLFIDKGFPLEVRDERGMTPLHYACRTGTRQIIEMLLKSGADVETKEDVKRGRTALMLLLHFGAWRTGESPGEVLGLVQTFVASGASVHARDSHGNTVMHHAMMCLDPSVVQALLDLGADLGATNDDGATPLHTLVGVGLFYRNIRGMEQEGFDRRYSTPNVPPHIEAAFVKLVLQASPPTGALTTTTQYGDSALALAIQNGKWVLAQVLYKADAPLLFTDDLSQQLEDVSEQGFYELARLLLRHGARPKPNLVASVCVMVPGQKPHVWASFRRSWIDNAPECFPLRDEALTIKKLLGAESEETDETRLPDEYTGFSAIQVAAERGVETRIVQALLEAGADPFAETGTGMDSFLLALVRGHEENLEALFGHAVADTHPRDHWLTNHLRNPDANPQLPTLDTYLFALQNANLINDVDTEGHTLLFHATTQSNPTLAYNLLTRGADPNTPDPLGWTSVHQAIHTKNLALLDLLLAHGGNVLATVSSMAPYSAARSTRRRPTTRRHTASARQHHRSPDAAVINALRLATATMPPQPEVVRLLLERGVDPNERVRNTGGLGVWDAMAEGRTPLGGMFLVERRERGSEFWEVVEMLVERMRGGEVQMVVEGLGVGDVVGFEGREGLWERMRVGLALGGGDGLDVGEGGADVGVGVDVVMEEVEAALS